ncbi:OsmC family protein [Flavobacteriaceae bacterium]|nr:OsmC family protein [Flavobacteriaceae bacterium]MDA8948217.1 OsmC family protein [Flavobacteriaceae bacterium]MDA9015945.1 OsmC family protein [Flavobacteriaceae bacterium]MDB3862183.1 OsmC family protein [Flavobacteriaceae bacterium]
MTSTVKYLGDLRTEGIHISSSKKLITDAPVDNHGKGEAFSPTDTIASGLGSCLLTIMGIKARELDIDLKETYAEVEKVMGSNPRRIVEIKVNVHLPNAIESKLKLILERAALSCPVAQSLHPDLKQDIKFHWPD